MPSRGIKKLITNNKTKEMGSKFQKGDKVRLKKGYKKCEDCRVAPSFSADGLVGTIFAFAGFSRYSIDFVRDVGGWSDNDGINNCQNICTKHLQKVEEINTKTIMQKLTSTLKRILSSELQKLYRAGLIDGNLELTEEGKNEIWAILLKQYESELVKVAEEKIAEEEKK